MRPKANERPALTTAMILAAGRGERLRPITDQCPKPLVSVAGLPLIVHHLQRLARAGIRRVIINHAWLGAQIEQTLKDGAPWGVHIDYSPEPPGGLETAGGIAHALPLIQAANHHPQAPFLLVNGDVFCDFDFQAWQSCLPLSASQGGAHLLLVPTPSYKPQGDFGLVPAGSEQASTDPPDALSGQVTDTGPWTFAGVSVMHPQWFTALRAQAESVAPAPLAPLLRRGIAQSAVTGEVYQGRWVDVGTPERLHALRASLTSQATETDTKD